MRPTRSKKCLELPNVPKDLLFVLQSSAMAADKRAGHWPCDSTAVVAAIGSGAGFARGRDFAAGLAPKQISTGDRTILGKISKTLFVQAGEVVLIRRESLKR